MTDPDPAITSAAHDTQADSASASPLEQATAPMSHGPTSHVEASGPALDARWTLQQVDAGELHQALSLLLTGRLKGGQQAAEHFLAFAQSRGMSLERFWLAFDEHRPVLAALIVEAPGKAGMIFLSPLIRDEHVLPAAALIQTLCLPQNTRGLSLIQMLLDPHQHREALASTEGGFITLAHLQYMRRKTRKAPSADLPILSEGLNGRQEIICWSQANKKLFADAILASYIDTLDCPGLLGLRQIDDIITGHMGAGIFTPTLWQVIHEGGKPCAVLLMNMLASGTAMELAYLGVAPEWRGKGLGKKLMQHALSLAHSYGADELLLAVDENNAPAMSLYRSLKFLPTARKVAMLRAVTK